MARLVSSLLVFLFTPLLFAQGRPIPPGLSQANQAEAQGERNVPPPLNQRPATDVAKLRREADELATLAQSVPPGVDQATRGILEKDLTEKLKRIEKLAKELRSEISK
jgi:hypothetical protein